ncbi:U3 snoRNP protein [Glugoides intestinalis]
MIDRAQKSLEIIAEELVSYRNRSLFNEKQMKKILENRKQFENKIARSNKRILDFVEYIESEKKLEKIRNKKIVQLKVGMEETDFILTRNIVNLYKKALYYFDEPTLLKDFAEYCIKKRKIDDMKTIFASKCLKNISDSEMWIFCAQKLWEIDDIDGARELFIKGISINNNSKLRVEFFRLECMYAGKLNKINKDFEVAEEDMDDLEKGKIALLVFNDILKSISEKEISECIEISSIVPGLKAEVKKLLE